VLDVPNFLRLHLSLRSRSTLENILTLEFGDRHFRPGEEYVTRSRECDVRDNHIAEHLFTHCSTQSSDKTRTAALGSIHPLIRKVTGDVSPCEKLPGLHTHHFHPSSTEVRNEWNHVSNPCTFTKSPHTKSRLAFTLTTYIHLAPRLGMSGTMFLSLRLLQKQICFRRLWTPCFPFRPEFCSYLLTYLLT
jgi:hypothetical protein